MAPNLSQDQLQFLGELPLLLNSSLKTDEVIAQAVQGIRPKVQAEAATVFLKDLAADELLFWVLEGGQAPKLSGRRMPLNKGIVGWVMTQAKSALVTDVKNDPRFFKEITEVAPFETRDMICVPLIGRHQKVIGALQLINRSGNKTFTASDLAFSEAIAPLLSLAIENAQLFEALEERNRILEAVNRKKDQIISVISHEFRTPLNIISASSEMLAYNMVSDPATRTRVNDMLAAGIQRLAKTVSSLRSLEAMDGDALLIKPEPVAIDEMLRDLALSHQNILKTRKLELTLTLAAPGILIKADRALLAVCLKNLLANAIRFTPDGGGITLQTKTELGLVEIAVIDTGIGIAPELQEAIFEKLYEVVDAVNHSSGNFEFRSGGLGVGLSATRAMLEAHGSVIEVKSEVGHGSRFSFRLPVSQQNQLSAI